MKPTEFWKWWVIDEVTGKRRKTTYVMTRETAVERYGKDVEPVSGSMEVRNLPETYEEQHRSSGWWSDDKKKQ